MRALEQELFQVGVVVGIHGLRGDLKVRPLSDGSTILLTAGEVWLARPGGKREHYVPVRCTPHKKNLLVNFHAGF